MGGVIDEVVMAGMRHIDPDGTIVDTDPINLLHHFQEGVAVGAKVLKRMIEQDLRRRIAFPCPRRHLQILDNIGFTGGKFVDVYPAFKFVESTSQIQFHHPIPVSRIGNQFKSYCAQSMPATQFAARFLSPVASGLTQANTHVSIATSMTFQD
jgi:hypothetical protein